MIISDLSHLEPISECTDIVGGAEVIVGAIGAATGNATNTNATGYTNAVGGRVNVAYGLASAGAVGVGGNATAATAGYGAAQGTLVSIVIPLTINVSTGSVAMSQSLVFAFAADAPKRP
jgi:hypothetical protein